MKATDRLSAARDLADRSVRAVRLPTAPDVPRAPLRVAAGCRARRLLTAAFALLDRHAAARARAGAAGGCRGRACALPRDLLRRAGSARSRASRLPALRRGAEPGRRRARGTGEAVDLGPSRRRLIAGIVPGVGWECFADWLNASGTAPTHLRQFGYDARLFEVSGLSGSGVNAQQLRDMILAMQLEPAAPRLVLIGYSKGAPDMLEAVVRVPGDPRPRCCGRQRRRRRRRLAARERREAVAGRPAAALARREVRERRRQGGREPAAGSCDAPGSRRTRCRRISRYYSRRDLPDPASHLLGARSSYRKLSKDRRAQRQPAHLLRRSDSGQHARRATSMPTTGRSPCR